MMGFQTAEARLFYDFCLDDHVPSDHPLRSIDGYLDLDGLRQTLKPFCLARSPPPSAIAIAVRNVSGRRRWSKLDEWLRLGAPSRSSNSSKAD